MGVVTTIGDAAIHHGDVREVLRTLPDGLAQTVVTSPPYWGLRDYGVDGQIGLEATPEEFIETMVGVFREVRRVLRDDGTAWVNMGDSYASGGRKSRDPGQSKLHPAFTGDENAVTAWRPADPEGVKPKDLVGIPWMLAFALRADGWYLRQDIIWHKPNPMPESVRDRCTKAHEYIFLLSKSERYFFDAEAIKEVAVGNPPGNKTHKGATAYEGGAKEHRTKQGLVAYAAKVSDSRKAVRSDIESRHRSQIEGGQSLQAEPDGRRNKRSVWTVASQPFSGAHFATFPPKLIEPCILAGAPAGGLVLDPFHGAGTTGMVALEQGRRYVGIELNREYIDLSVPRLAEAAGQIRLFG